LRKVMQLFEAAAKFIQEHLSARVENFHWWMSEAHRRKTHHETVHSTEDSEDWFENVLHLRGQNMTRLWLPCTGQGEE
jgi:hypothetical protein